MECFATVHPLIKNLTIMKITFIMTTNFFIHYLQAVPNTVRLTRGNSPYYIPFRLRYYTRIHKLPLYLTSW